MEMTRAILAIHQLLCVGRTPIRPCGGDGNAGLSHPVNPLKKRFLDR